MKTALYQAVRLYAFAFIFAEEGNSSSWNASNIYFWANINFFILFFYIKMVVKWLYYTYNWSRSHFQALAIINTQRFYASQKECEAHKVASVNWTRPRKKERNKI